MGIHTPNQTHTPLRQSGSGLLLSQFPLRPIPNAALEGKGSFENHRFQTARYFLSLLTKYASRQTRNYCWEKWAVGGTAPTKEKHPSERKKPAKRERIPTTSLRTGLGMTGLAYERIFSSPIKSTLPCTVSLRGNRRSAACGGYSEAVSRKCPGFHATTWLEIG